MGTVSMSLRLQAGRIVVKGTYEWTEAAGTDPEATASVMMIDMADEAGATSVPFIIEGGSGPINIGRLLEYLRFQPRFHHVPGDTVLAAAA